MELDFTLQKKKINKVVELGVMIAIFHGFHPLNSFLKSPCCRHETCNSGPTMTIANDAINFF